MDKTQRIKRQRRAMTAEEVAVVVVEIVRGDGGIFLDDLRRIYRRTFFDRVVFELEKLEEEDVKVADFLDEAPIRAQETELCVQLFGDELTRYKEVRALKIRRKIAEDYSQGV